MWRHFNILYLLCFIVSLVTNENIKSRQKRYLIFTDSTQWGVFATIAIPLPDPETTVSVAWFYEVNYYIVDNATWLVQPFIDEASTISRGRSERSTNTKEMITRRSLYDVIESMLEKHGFLGRPCLLRAICESTTNHFLHNGLVGDVIHLALTPSASKSEEDIEDIYYEAEYNGLESDCSDYIDDCPLNPLEHISASVEDMQNKFY